MEIICKVCGTICKNKGEHINHVRWKHSNTKSDFSNISKSLKIKYEEKLGKIIEKTVKCNNPKCGVNFTIKERDCKTKPKYFCSKSCANSRTFTKETNLRRAKSNSKASKELWENEKYVNKIVNSTFSIFRSTCEIEIFNWLTTKYPQYEWSCGGSIKYMNERLVRDAYSNVIKVCIEYDGVWHFKDINGQLEMKKRKDFMLNEWCKLNNYKIIRISEAKYTEDKEACLLKLDELIHNTMIDLFLIY